MARKEPQSITSSFLALYGAAPDRCLFTWVDSDGRDTETLTVRELAETANSIAKSLPGWGLVPGDRVMLVYPPGLDFVKAFVGCLAAGVLPIPVYPPSPGSLARDLVTFGKIVEIAEARVALTNGVYDRARRACAVSGLFTTGAPRWPGVSWHRTDRRLPPGGELVWYRPSNLDEVAFLQFTSGSTADPKGVMVTHANLAHEIAANVTDLRLNEGTRGVFWIPQYHDMGLINVILSTVVGNSITYLMSPMTFLRCPAVWLDVMSRVRATVTSAPNFAYELAVRKTTPLQRAGWDLSSLDMAICAAEPVRDRTVQSFLGAFAVSGVRQEMFFTAYGLAENTASVTNRGTGRIRLDAEALVAGQVVPTDDARAGVVYYGCGRSTKPGDRILIVDPDSRNECPPGSVGEIWVQSATTAAGYWGMPELTEQTFQATPEYPTEPGDTYLRTGDLGFWHDGELYVTGRIKDMVIVRGRNVYPTDIEDSVRDSHPLIRPGGVLAFSVEPDGEEGGERIVVLVETRAKRLREPDAEEISATVRRAVYTHHHVPCDTVVVGKVGLVRKTTSGKLRRNVCKREFVRGALQRDRTVLHVSRPALAGGAR